MKQHKALVFRLYPNKIQEAIIHQTFGCTRFIYNHYLSKNQQLYQNENKKLSCFDAIKDLPNNYPKYPWLKEVDSMSLRTSLFDLENAYQKLFKKKSGHPKFKNKYKDRLSYRTNYVNDNIRINLVDSIIHLPKLKDIAMRGYRNLGLLSR